MVKALYLDDSYVKEFEATVESVKDDKYVVLSETAFYPNSGGQLHDTGKFIKNGEEFNVVYAAKFGDIISHEAGKPGLKQGDKVKGIIDWDRRYRLMRMHTAAHVLSAIFHKQAGALITGNQLDLDKSRIDFDLENFDREKIDEYVAKGNELIDKDLPVTVSYMPREEALQKPELARLAKGLPEAVKTIRIISIGDFDEQADGGTHVKSLKEVGHLEIVKCENKGKNNRRVYFRLKEWRKLP